MQGELAFDLAIEIPGLRQQADALSGDADEP